MEYNQGVGVFNDRLNAVAITRVLISVFLGMEIHKALDTDFDMDSYTAAYESMVDGTFSRSPKRQKITSKSGSKRKLAEKEAQK